MTSLCDVCQSPVDANLCVPCGRDLEQHLHNIESLAAEIVVTYLRQGRTTRDIPIRGGERPLPWDERASEVTGILNNTLSTWARLISEERSTEQHPIELPAVDRRHQAARLAHWITEHIEWVRHQDWAGEMHDEIGHAARLLTRLVDRPADRQYLGPCSPPDCETEIYCRPGATSVVCPTCHGEHDVAQRREWLLMAVEDQLASATDIAVALSHFGQGIKAPRIWQWAKRGRIVSHGDDRRGRPLYRVGDVLDLLVKAA